MSHVPDSPVSPPALNDGDEVDFRDYLRVLGRYRLTVAAVTVLGIVLGLTASLVLAQKYTATAEIALEEALFETFLDPGDAGRGRARSPHTEAAVIESDSVQSAVETAIGSEVPPASAFVVGNSDVIRIIVRGSDPERAAQVTTQYATTYIELRQRQRVDSLEAAAVQARQKVDDLQADIAALDERAAGGDASASVERFGVVARQSEMRQLLSQLEVAASATTGGATIVTPAEPPDDPSGLTTPIGTALGAILGLAGGVALALVRNYFNDTIREPADVVRGTRGLPVLGIVGGLNGNGGNSVVALDQPDGSTTEALRLVRAAVAFAAAERNAHVLQITSASDHDQKTAIAVNLAVLLAQANERVVLVDADLRHPSVHAFFGLTNDAGLTSAAHGAVANTVRTVDSVPGLAVLSSGPAPSLPVEFLGSPTVGDVIDELRAEFDLVIIDSPPVVRVADASVLAPRVEGVLLVAAAGSTTRSDAHRAMSLLRQVNAPVLGAILNSEA